MYDRLIWVLFWPFIIIVPLALLALFKHLNPRAFELLMFYLHKLKSEESANDYWEYVITVREQETHKHDSTS